MRQKYFIACLGLRIFLWCALINKRAKAMRFFILGVIRITDLLVALGLLILLGAGIYSIWLDFLNKPSFIYKGLTLLLAVFLSWLAGKGLNKLIQRKLDLDPPQEYWRAETFIHYKQYGNSVLAPPAVAMVYLLPIFCLLPIFYSILYTAVFWILMLILLAISVFCFSHFKYGLVQKQVQATYYPRTQAFVDFYLKSSKGEWNEEQEQLFQKIDSSSNDFKVAQQIRALAKEGRQINYIYYDYIDIGYGPGFDATPENIAAKDHANFDSIDAMLKTLEHLG